jgi:hypothetical protein
MAKPIVVKLSDYETVWTLDDQEANRIPVFPADRESAERIYPANYL